MSGRPEGSGGHAGASWGGGRALFYPGEPPGHDARRGGGRHATGSHTGPGGGSNWSLVYDLLETTPWEHPESSVPKHAAFAGSGKALAPRINACWLYGELYRARNDFLHGNPVDDSTLRANKTGQRLFLLAPLLYRMALTAFLQMRVPKATPENDLAAVRKYTRDAEPQFVIERALLRAHVKT